MRFVPTYGDPGRTIRERRLQMRHREDGAQSHKPHAVAEETVENAVAHILPGQGTTSLWVLGELVTYKVPSQQTGGAYSLFEVATQPGAGPPAHIQHREDESFYVLEGEYEFLVEGYTMRAEAGSLLYIPNGTLHAHKNVGEGMGRMLVTQTPGGLYERFFEEAGKPADDRAGPLVFEDRLAVANIVAIAAEYGIEMPPSNAE
jgi:quercetin dioxygenase-like cupin family protein